MSKREALELAGQAQLLFDKRVVQLCQIGNGEWIVKLDHWFHVWQLTDLNRYAEILRSN